MTVQWLEKPSFYQFGGINQDKLIEKVVRNDRKMLKVVRTDREMALGDGRFRGREPRLWGTGSP
jgi:hypothetical protein